jgi:hypothetical protein
MEVFDRKTPMSNPQLEIADGGCEPCSRESVQPGWGSADNFQGYQTGIIAA